MRKYFLKKGRIGFSCWNENDEHLAFLLWGDSAVTKYICANKIFTETEVRQRLYLEIENFQQYQVQYFPVFSLENQELIGCCGLRPYCNKKDVFEIGIHLRKKFWRQGYGYEIMQTMIAYAFNVKQVKKLIAGHHPENKNSKKLLMKLGFQYQGREYYEPTRLYHPSYRLKNKEKEKVYG